MEINEMVIIYLEGNTFQYLATEQAIATATGMLDMAHSLIMDKWLDHPPDAEIVTKKPRTKFPRQPFSNAKS